MTEQIFIKKIKVLNDNTAEIQYTTSDDLEKGNITFTGEQEITGEFKTAFQNTVEGFLGCMPLLDKDKKHCTQ